MSVTTTTYRLANYHMRLGSLSPFNRLKRDKPIASLIPPPRCCVVVVFLVRVPSSISGTECRVWMITSYNEHHFLILNHKNWERKNPQLCFCSSASAKEKENIRNLWKRSFNWFLNYVKTTSNSIKLRKNHINKQKHQICICIFELNERNEKSSIIMITFNILTLTQRVPCEQVFSRGPKRTCTYEPDRNANPEDTTRDQFNSSAECSHPLANIVRCCSYRRLSRIRISACHRLESQDWLDKGVEYIIISLHCLRL